MAWAVLLGVLAVVVATTTAYQKVEWTSLIATWGRNGIEDQENGIAYFEIPLTKSAAESSGWNKISSDKYTSKWCFNNDPGIILICDNQGNIAGIGVAVVQKVVDNADCFFYNKNIFEEIEISNKIFYASYYYLVSQEKLKEGGRKLKDGEGPMKDTSLYLPTAKGNAIVYEKLSHNQNEFPEDLPKQKCVPKMGMHYYYNMTGSDQKCINLNPWFVTTDVQKEALHGVGFQLPGTPDSRYCDNVAPTDLKYAVNDPPTCLLDALMECNAYSTHMYFISEPWSITC